MSVFETFKAQFSDFISKCEQMEEKIKRLEDENRKLKSENEKLKSLKNKQVEEVEEEVEEVEECPICKDEFSNKIKLPCNHEFCTDCLYMWTNTRTNSRTKPTCPMCRTKFNMSIFSESDSIVNNTCNCGGSNINHEF